MVQIRALSIDKQIIAEFLVYFYFLRPTVAFSSQFFKIIIGETISLDHNTNLAIVGLCKSNIPVEISAR